MLLLRAALLEILLCFHVIGAAVLFRRLFPRESPWLAFIVPVIAVMAVANFLEHFIPLPSLGWLLPLTLAGLLWAMLQPDVDWRELRLPSLIFLAVFTWAFAIKCFDPQITNNTEGVADMARVLDFCHGETLPPTDSWCPPYDHGGYYTFQHYGASLLRRLFSLDIGTGYNLGFTLLNTLTCVVAAGAAYRVSGNRMWVALATLLVVLANFTGSAPYLLFRNPLNPDFALSVDIGDSSEDPVRNPFAWIFKNHADHAVLRLFTPTFNTYFPEFHANLGGHFMTISTMLAANEAFRFQRSNWPWICLIVFPFMTLITATWYIIVVGVLCVGCLAAALIAQKRPENGKVVLVGAAVAILLLWPSVNTLIGGSYPVPFFWTWTVPQYFTPFWEFAVQWWPIYIPWFLLLFTWRRMNLLTRWIYLAVPLLLGWVEIATFGDRGLTVEKMWGAIYSVGLVTFLPLVFRERALVFRFLTVIFLFLSAIFIVTWGKLKTDWVDWHDVAFHLKGDTVFQNDTQKRRLLQVMKRLHGVTILPGKSAWSYNQAPQLVGVSENRCYIAWFAQEYQCGHGGEAEYRDVMDNSFYAGTLPDPLAFLRSNAISAILIWPEDLIPDALLDQMKKQLASDYFYVDCKMDGPNNAGIFMPQNHQP